MDEELPPEVSAFSEEEAQLPPAKAAKGKGAAKASAKASRNTADLTVIKDDAGRGHLLDGPGLTIGCFSKIRTTSVG